MKSKMLATAAIVLGTVLSACGGYASGFVAYGPPPPPRYGVIGVAPGPGYIWTDGYWNRVGGSWAWVGGRWAVPPRGRRVWVRPEWRAEGNRYRFHRGYWR
jgi:YXWGXW repeat-containing protein